MHQKYRKLLDFSSGPRTVCKNQKSVFCVHVFTDSVKYVLNSQLLQYFTVVDGFFV